MGNTICCANCAFLIPSNNNCWCDMNEHEVMDPKRYRCPDFDLFDCDDSEDSIKQEGLL